MIASKKQRNHYDTQHFLVPDFASLYWEVFRLFLRRNSLTQMSCELKGIVLILDVAKMCHLRLTFVVLPPLLFALLQLSLPIDQLKANVN